MKIVRCCFVVLLLWSLTGCAWLAGGAGVEEYTDANGVKRVKVNQTSPMDTAAGLIGSLGPWGIAAAAALRLGSKVIRHREILAHGQKDDDYDGIPDDQETPKPPAPSAS